MSSVTDSAVPVSMFTRLRGNAAKFMRVRVRVTPTDVAGPPTLSSLNRVLRTGYIARRSSPSSPIQIEDTRYGRYVSCDGNFPAIIIGVSEYAASGRYYVDIPAGLLRRTAKRPPATANLTKKQASKRAKIEQEFQGAKPQGARPKLLKNHFILVADASGSMAYHADGAAKLFNEQLIQLEKSNASGEQINTVTLFRFKNTDNIEERYYNVPPSMVPKLDERSWEPNGESTPLYDAVVIAAQRAMADTDPERSFVVFVLTDGEENASARHNADALRAFIATQQATDRWTFVFMVPHGYAAKFCATSGVPVGNVKEWNQIDDAEIKTSGIATQSYLSLRKTGARSSKSWFVPDLSTIDATKLAKLRDVTDDVAVWTVPDQEDVRTFVDRKSKGQFDYGKRFFEFTKKEDGFADYKQLLLLDKASKRIYTDSPSHSVRTLIGLSTGTPGGATAIDPTAANLGNFALFGQSTSTNRILPRGTRVAFWS